MPGSPCTCVVSESPCFSREAGRLSRSSLFPLKDKSEAIFAYELKVPAKPRESQLGNTSQMYEQGLTDSLDRMLGKGKTGLLRFRNL